MSVRLAPLKLRVRLAPRMSVHLVPLNRVSASRRATTRDCAQRVAMSTRICASRYAMGVHLVPLMSVCLAPLKLHVRLAPRTSVSLAPLDSSCASRRATTRDCAQRVAMSTRMCALR